MRTLALLLGLALLTPLSAAADAQPLTVLAAASLKLPLEQSAAEFERAHPGTKVVVSAAATGVLVKQVEAGAPADVLVGAAAEPLAPLQAAKKLGTPKIVARNELVVAAPAASKATIASLADLKAPAFKRIGVGKAQQVPAGDYALESLGKAGVLEAVKPRLVYGESVTQVLTWVRGGDVDVGFVYASDVAGAKGTARTLFTVPDALHAPIVYPAAVVAASKQPALAQAYVEFLAGASGQAALHAAGFLPP